MPQLRIWPLAAVLLCSPTCRAALGHGVPGRGASLLTWAQLGVFWPPGRYQPECIRVKWRRGQLEEQAAGWVSAACIDLERKWIDQSRQLSQHGGRREAVGPWGEEGPGGTKGWVHGWTPFLHILQAYWLLFSPRRGRCLQAQSPFTPSLCLPRTLAAPQTFPYKFPTPHWGSPLLHPFPPPLHLPGCCPITTLPDTGIDTSACPAPLPACIHTFITC